ncbi:hypothetical protein [Streptomyces sp. RKAG293]|uniref:hypothetical protein n=1 Tax=Streptomyces sp. RKAG293 TaxID=2893403 RepID=UPI0035A91246
MRAGLPVGPDAVIDRGAAPADVGAQESGPPRASIASLDHAMWFHQPCRVDEYLQFAKRSPIAADGRGFAQGEFHTENGMLSASVPREALIWESGGPGNDSLHLRDRPHHESWPVQPGGGDGPGNASVELSDGRDHAARRCG